MRKDLSLLIQHSPLTIDHSHPDSYRDKLTNMSEQLIPATITIADRSYRIKLHPKDEEVVRKTVKTINDKIIEFKTAFAGKDMQDYVAMALVWYATDQMENPASDIERENVTDKLNLLERMLDAQLQS